MKTQLFFFAPLLALVACGEANELTPPEATRSPLLVGRDGVVYGPSTTVTNVTISGRVFFDDWRDFGRFALRKDKSGVSGVHHSMDGDPNDSNYLGLRDAKVTIYEVDSAYLSVDNCSPTSFLASTVVASDGTWSVVIPAIIDPCSTDNDLPAKVKLSATVTLEFCDDARCFSVVDPSTSTVMTSMTPWSESLVAAAGSSLSVGNNGVVTTADLHFEDTTTLHDTTDIRSEAALIFAGMVDVTRKFHVQASWPGHVADYGEVFLQFPTDVDTGVTSGTSSIKMKEGQLKMGWTAIHEYGHILDNRITSFSDNGWGPNSLTPCGNDFSKATTSSGYVLDTADECDSWSRNGEKEFKAKAYGEGFADFVAHVTLDAVTAAEAPTGSLLGCSQAGYDDNASLTSPVLSTLSDMFGRKRIFGCTAATGCVDGAAYPTNVARALCDWFDGRNDDDGSLLGAGDRLSETLLTIHDTLEDAYNDLGAATVSSQGITACDVFTTRIGQVANDADYVDLIYNNGFSCGL